MARIFREFHGISCNSQGRSTKRPSLQQYKNFKTYSNLMISLRRRYASSVVGSAEADRN
jgi:hypothetical protein